MNFGAVVTTGRAPIDVPGCRRSQRDVEVESLERDDRVGIGDRVHALEGPPPRLSFSSNQNFTMCG
jgi:hypothetical protein